MPQPILLMVQSLGHGGCERDAAKLAVGLDQSRFSPHIAVLRAGGYRAAEVSSAGIPIIHLPVQSFMKPSLVAASRQLGAYVRAHSIKLIHAFDVPTDIFGAFSGRFYRVPRVVTAQLSFRSLVRPRERMLLRLADRLSDVVIVNSRAVGDSLQRDYRVPAEKIYLCYNGVNSQEFYPGTGVRPDYLRDASVVVGSVCVMRPEKRVDWLLQSFAEARSVNPNAKLLLVGSGPEVGRLQELRDRLGLSEVCFFEPGRPDVADWMRSMDVYINASVSESFPNALLEAMACGCCVIGSRVGGIPELISHRESGLLFDSNNRDDLTDCIRLALSEPELCSNLGENACAVAHSRFPMHVTVERMQTLYQRLLDPLIARVQR